ncbi:hypothetical protein [Wenjunlia tyrosinilytica]|uniref:Uncharacterized protein n=1 Tax=Wenjunlia tyrosinilytica TaxID=1544741 RepID=A0A917ZY03_9ACTN|nr:hypothetical protein [Wenjunlia tyrosinilytica]GGO98352.1 hypothetical protein GCM10012280_62290 [Wenjunlia tyrosinilytica]
MSEPYDEDPQGLPCVLSKEVAELLMDKALPGEVFGAIVAATVVINQTRGEVPGSTASAKWPQQRRMPLGADGSLGIAEYVIVADADPRHIVLTRIQLY